MSGEASCGALRLVLDQLLHFWLWPKPERFLCCRVQAANGALKASISSVQQERTQLSELLRQLQDDFVQHSCQLSSDAQTLAAQVHDTNGSMHALSCLQRVSTDDVRAVAGQSALEEVIGGSIHDAADQGAVEHA